MLLLCTEISHINEICLRQAINYAINKQDLLDGALNGIGTIANAPLNSLHLGYNDSIPFNEYDLDAAKAKMVEAGYPDGFSCNLMVNSNNAVSMKIAQIMQNQLAQIGIDVSVEQLEKAAWSDNLNKVNFEFALGTLNWSDTNNMVTYLYHTNGGLQQLRNGRNDREGKPDSGYRRARRAV